MEELYQKGMELWETKALELGMQGAVEHQIGWCYEKLGDFSHAIEWYMKGAEKGIGYPDADLWLKEKGL